jgi:hypothetical protein
MGIGKLFSTVADFVGGGLFKEVKDTVMAYLPPDMSDLQKAEFNLKVSEALAQKQSEANKMLSEASAQLDKRISEQEGTAADLKVLGWVGKPIIFLRGVQRPLWGYATLWIDVQWFFGSYIMSDKQNLALIVINILVLGFLFGERAVLNLQPLIEKVFSKGQ